jgi:acyl-[acyl carrier protein]--UDP-N-acetylglucosamine O-acyltransferase
MRVNSVGLKRSGHTPEDINAISLAYKTIKQEGVKDGLAALENTAQQSKVIALIVDFYRRSEKGVIAFYKKGASE